MNSPSRSGSYTTSHRATACIFGIHGDAILFALSQSVLNTLFDLAFLGFSGGHALHEYWASRHLFIPIFYVDFVTAAIIGQVSRLVLPIPEILNFNPTRHLIRTLDRRKAEDLKLKKNWFIRNLNLPTLEPRDPRIQPSKYPR